MKLATEEDLLNWLAWQQVESAPHQVRTIVDATDTWLEETHDWIQWALPLPSRSRFDATAPTLSAEKFATLTKEQRTTIMACFFKFSKFLLDKQNWAHATRDHNWYRITRAITCMRLIGRNDEAKHMLEWVCDLTKDNPHCIVNAWQHWSDALNA